jgi:pyrroloquinoline quinone biosynthesis protein E
MASEPRPLPPSSETGPLWLLAELTYACPLQCPYCSNPLDYARRREELSTEEWTRVLEQARELGAVQLGLSGGEPALRRDLEQLVARARGLGYYTNLITSGVGLDVARLEALRQAGLDHVQVSFQAADAALNDSLAGTACFEHKLAVARQVKALGYPMVLCFVLHRRNLHQVAEMLRLAEELGADYVELATTQYYGWALRNRAGLLPRRAQLLEAEAAVAAYRRSDGGMQVYYVVPDYYETRPKPCMHGWGSLYLVVAPDGIALPCHAAGELPGMEFPNLRHCSVEWAWTRSAAFRRFRGEEWMRSPCRDCPERRQDFGGCRCQAFLLTGDAANADPVCSRSPYHGVVEAALAEARAAVESGRLRYRNSANSRDALP